MSLEFSDDTDIKYSNMNKQENVPLYPGSSLPPKVLTDQPGATAVAPINTQKLVLGPSRTSVTCPQCRASIRTSIKHTVTTRTHMTAMLCHFSCCCCLPYCMDSARNTDHYCPNCNTFLGTYEK